VLEGNSIITLIERPGGSYLGSLDGLVEMRRGVAVAGAHGEVRQTVKAKWGQTPVSSLRIRVRGGTGNVARPRANVRLFELDLRVLLRAA
jgi:hypothetical protein